MLGIKEASSAHIVAEEVARMLEKNMTLDLESRRMLAEDLLARAPRLEEIDEVVIEDIKKNVDAARTRVGGWSWTQSCPAINARDQQSSSC